MYQTASGFVVAVPVPDLGRSFRYCVIATRQFYSQAFRKAQSLRSPAASVGSAMAATSTLTARGGRLRENRRWCQSSAD
jgi:hypothetical protein